MKSMVWVLKFIWLWPPLLGSGIRVITLSKDLTKLTVQLKTRFWNQNYFGTHYGGSLFSMTDPFYALMLVHLLGKDFIVWDKSASIRYKIATREPVFADFEVTRAQLKTIREQLNVSNVYEPTFTVQITNRQGDAVAIVERKLHIQRKNSLKSPGLKLDNPR